MRWLAHLDRWCRDLEPNYKAYLALYFALAIATGWVSFHARKMGIQEAAEFQHGIFLGDRSHGFLSAVHATRVLFPTILHFASSLSAVPVPFVFATLRLLSIFAAYVLFHVYLRKWFDTKSTLIGTLFLAASIPVTFIEWIEIPTDFIELIITTLGFMCIRAGRDWLLYLVLAVGTLNRETAGYLAIVYFFNLLYVRESLLRTVLKTGGACVLWLTIYLGLKFMLHAERLHYFFDSGAFRENYEGIMRFLSNWNFYNNYLSWFYLFNVFWVLSFVGLRRKPLFIRRSMMSLPIFLLILLLGSGGLDEAREIIPLYPLLIPAGLMTLLGEHRSERPAS